MYKDGYVLAILAHGNVLEEDNSKRVGLPFGIEYKVRLINKNSHRCAADLIINGEKISRFILNDGETSDIERYLDDNLNSGSKFKFTHLNDSRVKDKKDIDNGIIEVHFFKEKKKQEPIIIREEHHHWDYVPYYTPSQPCPKDPHHPWGVPMWGDNNKLYCSSGGKGMSAGGEAMMFNACSIPTSARSMSEIDGATVRGSESTQKFVTVSGYEFESVATILKIKIVNGEIQVVSKYCSGCGRKRREGEKYCSNCGTKI